MTQPALESRGLARPWRLAVLLAVAVVLLLVALSQLPAAGTSHVQRSVRSQQPAVARLVGGASYSSPQRTPWVQ